MTTPTGLLPFLLVLAFAPPASAFTWRHFGIRAGTSQSTLQYELEGFGTQSVGTERGPAIGAFAEAAPLDTPVVTLEIEALFTRSIRLDHEAVVPVPLPGKSSSPGGVPLQYLTFPLLVRVRLLPRVISPHILFGPSLAVKLSGNGTPVLDALERAVASLVLGAGADVRIGRHRMEVEVRYSYGVTGSGHVERPFSDVSDATVHSTIMLVGVGF